MDASSSSTMETKLPMLPGVSRSSPHPINGRYPKLQMHGGNPEKSLSRETYAERRLSMKSVSSVSKVTDEITSLRIAQPTDTEGRSPVGEECGQPESHEEEEIQPLIANAKETPSTLPTVPEANEFSAVKLPSLRKAPKWLEFDKQVLRFYAYYEEQMAQNLRLDKRAPNSDNGIEIIRCVILYYLEDSTLRIDQVKVKNSGMPEGTFLKRSVAKHEETRKPIKEADLLIGKTVKLAGRDCKIVGSDEFTRSYLQNKLGINMSAPIGYPDDSEGAAGNNSYHQGSGASTSSSPLGNKRGTGVTNPQKRPDTLGKFLKHDRQVLRFFCHYVPPNRGPIVKHTLHYYLGDDTIELREDHEHNSGRGSFSRLLQRQKLPRGFNDGYFSSIPGMGSEFYETHGFVSPQDIRCGETVNAFGRILHVVDCDAFTRRYYAENLALQQREPPLVAPISSLSEREKKVKAKAGNGRKGSAAAAQGTVRASAKFAFPKTIEDQERRFVIKYFLADASLSVFEPPKKNSGISTGKFLENAEYLIASRDTPSERRSVEPEDFEVGAVMALWIDGTVPGPLPAFEILAVEGLEDREKGEKLRTDPALQAARERLESVSDIQALASKAEELTLLPFRRALRAADVESTGELDFSLLREVLKANLSPSSSTPETLYQDLLALATAFEQRGNGSIAYECWLDQLCVDYWANVDDDSGLTSLLRDFVANYCSNAVDEWFSLRGTFRSFGNDPKGKGVISRDDFVRVMKSLSNEVTDQQLSHLLSTFTLPGATTGAVSYKDFCDSLFSREERNGLTQMGGKATKKPEDQLSFPLPESDGKVPQELRRISSAFCAAFVKRRHQLRKNFLAFDVQKSKHIGYDDFCTVLEKTNPDFGPAEREELLAYVFPMQTSEINYAEFTDKMFRRQRK